MLKASLSWQFCLAKSKFVLAVCLAKSKFVFIIQTNHTTKTCLDPPAKISRFVLSTKTGVGHGGDIEFGDVVLVIA